MKTTRKTYFVMVLLCALLVAGILLFRQGRVARDFTLDYGGSGPYTQAEIDAAAAEVKRDFKRNHYGSVLNSLAYTQDGDSGTMYFSGSYTIKKTVLSGLSGGYPGEDSCHGWGWTVAQDKDGDWRVVSEGYG